MIRFKVGDKVRCISNLVPKDVPIMGSVFIHNKVTIGTEFIVTHTDDRSQVPVLWGVQHNFVMPASCFERVNSNSHMPSWF